MKQYMRGTTEVRFDVNTTLTTYDPAGRIVKTRKSSSRLEFVKGRFKGAGMEESQEGDWTSTIRVSHANRDIVGFELISGIELLMQPTFVFGPDSQSKWLFDISEPSGSDAFSVAYRPKVACSSFEVTADGFRPKKGFCGSGKITIDEHGENPLAVMVEGTGLPLNLGKGVLTEYRGESSFQYVSLEGTKQRLVVPKDSSGTFSFNDHKTVIRSSYKFHPGKG